VDGLYVRMGVHMVLRSGLVCGVDHEERNGSLGCWRKCLNFMKTGLRWTNWHVRMLTDEDSLCVTWGSCTRILEEHGRM
jgi:hypothetical protein